MEFVPEMIALAAQFIYYPGMNERRRRDYCCYLIHLVHFAERKHLRGMSTAESEARKFIQREIRLLL